MSNPEDTASRVAPMKREVGQLRDHYLNPPPSEGLREKIKALAIEAIYRTQHNGSDHLSSLIADGVLRLLSPEAEGGGK
jgi:hypothetical protein